MTEKSPTGSIVMVIRELDRQSSYDLGSGIRTLYSKEHPDGSGATPKLFTIATGNSDSYRYKQSIRSIILDENPLMVIFLAGSTHAKLTTNLFYGLASKAYAFPLIYSYEGTQPSFLLKNIPKSREVNVTNLCLQQLAELVYNTIELSVPYIQIETIVPTTETLASELVV